MAAWDSADLLARLRTITRRPATDADLTDDLGYTLLEQAQLLVAYDLAAFVPDAMRTGTPATLTTSDQKVYTLTSGDWLGHVELYDGPGGPRLTLGTDWSDTGADFVVASANSVRTTGDRERTFSNGLYARYVPKPGVLAADTAPTLLPADARLLLVYKAAELYAKAGGLRDPSGYKDQYLEHRDTLVTAYRTLMAQGGGTGLWWHTGDFM